MPDRREFIRGTIAVTAAAGVLYGGLSAAKRRPTLFRILYDRRTPAGTAFGAEAKRRGVPVSATDSDLGGVWMNEIEPRWQREPVAIAGLTAGAPLFCLEYLARDYGLELVYRIEHALLNEVHADHALTGPEGLSGWIETLARAGRRWPAAAAALAVEFPDGLRPQPTIPLLDLARRTERAGAPLYSWLLAPRPSARRSLYTPAYTRMTKDA